MGAARTFGIVTLAVAGVCPGVAEAEDDEARARTLFFDGHDAADRGDHATACAKFEASLALFRRVSTLLNLGKCSEELGEITAALRYWTEGAALLEPTDPRMQLAKERIDALDARVPTLTIALPSTLPEDALVLVDDDFVDVGQMASLRVAPGEHRLVLRVAGHRDATRRLSLKEGERRRILLEVGPPIPSPEPTIVPEAPRALPPPPPPGLSDLQIGGIVVGAVGLAGLGLGAVTGGLALDRKSTVDEFCVDDVCSSQEGADAAASGRTLSTLSTVGFAVGGGALTAGILMLVLGGHDEAETGDVAFFAGPAGGGLTIKGRW